MTKQASLFNDTSSQINELTHVLTTDLKTLRGEITVLGQFVNNQVHDLNNEDLERSSQVYGCYVLNVSAFLVCVRSQWRPIMSA